jgi:hypothetical protein
MYNPRPALLRGPDCAFLTDRVSPLRIFSINHLQQRSAFRGCFGVYLLLYNDMAQKNWTKNFEGTLIKNLQLVALITGRRSHSSAEGKWHVCPEDVEDENGENPGKKLFWCPKDEGRDEIVARLSARLTREKSILRVGDAWRPCSSL